MCTPDGNITRILIRFRYFRANFDEDRLYTERRVRWFERETNGIILLYSFSGSYGMREISVFTCVRPCTSAG